MLRLRLVDINDIWWYLDVQSSDKIEEIYREVMSQAGVSTVNGMKRKLPDLFCIE